MPRPARVLALLLLLTSSAAVTGAPAGGAESFPMPASIAPRVDFWTRVYTEVGTNGGFIHDSENLALVYEVVSVPSGSSEAALERHVDQAKARARAALKALAQGQRQGLSKTEGRVLAQFPPGVSNRTLAAAAERVRFQRGQANKFKAGLERMGRWEPHVRRALRERGVPEDLKALPHVESSYNPEAHSHAGASGLWQFTRPTGRLYMRVDHVVDERRDPFVASEAAARLLRSNYERLDSWPLGITAYNHGPGGLAKAVRQLGSRDIGVIIERYRSASWGFASKNFYAEFLAARRIDQNPERYFGPIQKEAPHDHESVVLRQSYGAQALARALKVTSGELRNWNPALLKPVWTGARNVPAAYELRVPRRDDQPPASQLVAGVQGTGFQSAGEAQPHAEVAASGTHKVRRGETLGAIAARYGASSEEIMALNGIQNARRLREGQVLEIPGAVVLASPSGPAAEPVPATAPTPEADAPAGAVRAPISEAAVATLHRVERGETLIEIARRYEVSMARIAARNAIRDPRDLREGQTLEIPAPDRGDTPPVPSEAAAAAPSEPAASPIAAVDPVPAPTDTAAAPPAAAPRPAEPAVEATVTASPPPRPDPATPPARTHTIASGETLGSISRSYGVSIEQLAAANGVEDPRRLRPGQVLAIPRPGESVPAAEGAPAPEPSLASRAEPEPAKPAPKPEPQRGRYRVRSGDTLGSIARQSGTTPGALAEANGIDDPRSLRPGQVLELPTANVASRGAPPPAERIHVVRSGDTLYAIAARYGLRVGDIVRENDLRGHKLSIGQRLRLPPEAGAVLRN